MGNHPLANRLSKTTHILSINMRNNDVKPYDSTLPIDKHCPENIYHLFYDAVFSISYAFIKASTVFYPENYQGNYKYRYNHASRS